MPHEETAKSATQRENFYFKEHAFDSRWLLKKCMLLFFAFFLQIWLFSQIWSHDKLELQHFVLKFNFSKLFEKTFDLEMAWL